MKLKAFFDRVYQHVKIDTHFYQQVASYRFNWVNASEDRTLFIGGHYLGVYQVFFSLQDGVNFFRDILDSEMLELQQEVYKIPDINKDYLVSSDILNLTLVYLIHKTYHTKGISDKLKENIAKELAIIFGYKTMAVLHSNYFKFYITEAMAEQVFNTLNNKYLIKKYGSWQLVIEHRVRDVYPKGLHYRRILKFKTLDVVNVVNDMQGRYRGMFKNIYRELVILKEQGETGIDISTYDGMSGEGEELFKEVHSAFDLKSNIMHVIGNKDVFILPDHLKLTRAYVRTVTNNNLLKALTWMSENSFNEKYSGKIESFIEKVFILTIQYLSNNQINIKDRNQISKALGLLKGFWLSSRSDDVALHELREQGNKLLIPALETKRENILAATRNAIAVYLFIRAIM